MADISRIGMVSHYNSLAMYRQQQQQGTQQALTQPQQHVQAQQAAAVAAAAAAAAQQHPVTGIAGADGSQQYYYSYPHAHPHAAHHQPTGSQQYLEHADVLGWTSHLHARHYSHHIQYQHHPVAYQQQQQQQQQQQVQPMIAGMSDWSGEEGQQNGIGHSDPSPPITASGSEISSPGTSATPPANNSATNSTGTNSMTPRSSQIRSPYEWMKKPSYQSQPNPACSIAAPATTSVSALHELCTIDALGKTRTKDKYRVVYTDHQRLELEKEFHYSRYITIRRKAELASNLALSERQVKIWFQNRRAKDRKQSKKREELEQKDAKPMENLVAGGMASLATLGGMGSMLGGLMHGGPSPPLNLGPPPHPLALGHPPPPPPPPPASLHSHPAHQHPHSHSVLGL